MIYSNKLSGKPAIFSAETKSSLPNIFQALKNTLNINSNSTFSLGTDFVEGFTNQTAKTTLSHTPLNPRGVQVFYDLGSGSALAAYGVDYTISGKVITYIVPLSSQSVSVYYKY